MRAVDRTIVNKYRTLFKPTLEGVEPWSCRFYGVELSSDFDWAKFAAEHSEEERVSKVLIPDHLQIDVMEGNHRLMAISELECVPVSITHPNHQTAISMNQ